MRKSAPLILLCLILNTGFSQSYKAYSAYIYAFTRHVIWPDDFNQGDFEIIVLGETPLIDELKIMAAAKKVGERSIKITQVAAASEIHKCNIVFIPGARSADLAEVVGKVSNQSILIVTEEPGLGSKGSHINFIMREGKLAFELNQASTAKNSLKISSMLTGMAILI